MDRLRPSRRRLVALLPLVLLSLYEAPVHADPPPGSSAVLLSGRVRTRVTNQGHLGRLSWDTPGISPGAQWPGPSGVEIMRSIEFFVGAKDPEAVDPSQLRRVSFSGEWQPVTPTADHAIRSSYLFSPGGEALHDDDFDGRVDEEFLDGLDNDFDGAIDEDFATFGDHMLSATMRDNVEESESYSDQPVHHPLHLETRLRVWSFNHPAYADFVIADYTIRNLSDHELDSVVVGWQVDLTSGRVSAQGGPGSDDAALPAYPSASLLQVLEPDDPRRQFPHDPMFNLWVSPDSALCPRVRHFVRGFSVADADGDAGEAIAIPSLLLVDHTHGASGIWPEEVGFRAVRFARAGELPVLDLERYALAVSTEGVNPATGAPLPSPVPEVGNQVAMCSVGPFRHWQAGGEIRAVIALAVSTGSVPGVAGFTSDSALHEAGGLSTGEFLARYPALATAYALARAFEGDHVESKSGLPLPDTNGRELALIAPPSQQQFEFADCRDEIFQRTRTVTTNEYTHFDFDCDFCTGVYDFSEQKGLLHRRWVLPEPSTVDVGAAKPTLSLGPWTPNPARESATIRAMLAGESHVSATIHDATGRLVRPLFSGTRPTGPWRLSWDGRAMGGSRVPAGLYWLRLASPSGTTARRLVLLQP